ncbi:oxygen-insensitive NADPH nitroreductase [Paenibacillus psychroresistens]|uniref:Oxygen-insensitive NADPH nitroreductase n=1 Tax=Paenibacillus psychroresistens TaxID=1778678 RepID=A0A6B8RPS1_9BACL|nr:oxygen-insensitive NADPH nitroreductase [Paenibacillus psychroresistens]QGQ98009.1 oxygen-insensitive NADPH nitroreductase [Paenibacillus psychroresistens]
MNPTINQILDHRSIRKFKNEPISKEQIKAVIESAQMASSSSNMQAYTVIGITSPEKKRLLAEYAGNQAYIEEAPLFLVWCADLNRISIASKPYGVDEIVSSTENFIAATVDVALAAQNAAIAAESLGLGIVYIGGIRNKPKEVCELLKLPKLVYPVFGMCIGVPDQKPIKRPRLPLSAVYHEEEYDTAIYEEQINLYDESIRKYTIERSGGKQDTCWSKEMAAKISRPIREHMRSFLNEQGFKLE